MLCYSFGTFSSSSVTQAPAPALEPSGRAPAALVADSQMDGDQRDSGGTTCPTLLVQRRFSSKVASNVVNSISRIRQVMP